MFWQCQDARTVVFEIPSHFKLEDLPAQQRDSLPGFFQAPADRRKPKSRQISSHGVRNGRERSLITTTSRNRSAAGKLDDDCAVAGGCASADGGGPTSPDFRSKCQCIS